MSSGSAHSHDLRPFTHSHVFADADRSQRERALAAVTALTLLTMVAELLVGWWTGSLALTADGWHMGTHALALGGAVLAYRLSQRATQQRALLSPHAEAQRARKGGPAGFAFGGWKIEVLSAYTSGLLLLAVALWLIVESVERLLHPAAVAYGEALVVAVIGLAVNVASVWLLSRGAGGGHGHAHGHAHGHGHGAADAAHGQEDPDRAHHTHHAHDDAPHAPAHARPQGAHGHAHHGHAAAPKPVPKPAGHVHDHNFNAAYLHVLADAVTSVLAIGALAGGAWFGLVWLDPAVALLGAALIGQWSWSVLRGSAGALVDATEDPALTERVRALIEADGDATVADLHVWQVGAQAWCAALSVVADVPLAAAVYRERLAAVQTLRHVTVEVHRCPEALPAA